jgi:hypothetical protein
LRSVGGKPLTDKYPNTRAKTVPTASWLANISNHLPWEMTLVCTMTKWRLTKPQHRPVNDNVQKFVKTDQTFQQLKGEKIAPATGNWPSVGKMLIM